MKRRLRHALLGTLPTHQSNEQHVRRKTHGDHSAPPRCRHCDPVRGDSFVAACGSGSDDPPAAPTISQPPLAQTITVGGGATFSVTATGTPALTPSSYTWTLNGSPVSIGAFTIGACSGNSSTSNGGATLSLTLVSIQCNGATIAVTVSNGVNPNATASTTLTVNGTAPAITQPLLAQTVAVGGTATYTVDATGVPAPTYEWQIIGGPVLAAGPFTVGACSGSASFSNGDRTLALSGVSAGCDGRSVSVVARNAIGVSAPSGALLVVSTAPQITQVPLAQTITAGGGATFAVTATGSPTPTYAWTLNGSAVGSGAFTIGACSGNSSTSNGGATLSLTTVAIQCNGASIGLTVSNGINPNATASTTLTVNGTAPTITQPPLTQTITAGGGATFTVTATGTPAPTFAWTLNGSAVGSGAFTIGSCTGGSSTSNGGATLSLTTVSAQCTGATVGVTASNGINPNATASTTLTVNAAATPPVFTGQSGPQRFTAGGTATFWFSATGTQPITESWRINGVVLPFFLGPPTQLPSELAPCTGSYSNSAGLTLTNVAAACDGAIVVARLTNPAGFVDSNPMGLSLVGAAPVITAFPGPGSNAPRDEGQVATVTVTATGTNLTYQWLLTYDIGSTARTIPGATSASYTTPVLTQGYNNASLQVRVCSGLQPAGSGTDPGCTFSSLAAPLGQTYEIGASGACFGAPNGWCYRSPAPQGGDLTGLVLPDATFSPDAPVVAVGYGTVLESNDFGANWTVRFTTPRLDFRGLARRPDGARLYAPVAANAAQGLSGELYDSTDGGATWARSFAINTDESVNDIAFISESVSVAVGTGIWRSTDGGSGWTPVNTAAYTASETLLRVAGRGNTVLAVSDAGNILRSADGGATWNRVRSGSGERMVDVSLNGNGHAVAVAQNTTKIWVSTDAGASWIERNTLPFDPLFDNARAGGIDVNNQIVVLSSETKVIVSNDLGASWTQQAGGGPRSDRWRLALSDFGGGEALAVGRWGAMLRSGFGFNFYGIGGGGESGGIARGGDITALETADGVTLMLRDDYIGRSSDGGATWQGFSQPALALSMLDADRAFLTLLSAGTGTARVLRTDNSGQSWTEVGNQTGDWLAGIAMVNNGVGVLIGTRSFQPQVFRTTNGAAFWEPVPGLPSGFVPLSVRALNPAPMADPLTAVILVGSDDGRILRTANGGQSWLTLSPGINGNIRHIARISASTAILAADDGLWRSTDAGQTWTRVYDSTAFGSMTAVAADPAGGRCVAVGVVGVLIGSGCQTFGAPVDLPYVGELRAAAWPTLSNVLAGGKGGTLLINRNEGLPAAPPPPMGAFGQRAGAAAPRATAPSQRVVLPAAVGKQAHAAAKLRPVQPATRPSQAQRRPDPLPAAPPLRVGPQRDSLLPFARKPASAADGKAR